MTADSVTEKYLARDPIFDRADSFGKQATQSA
jgi:hypothetical protein